MKTGLKFNRLYWVLLIFLFYSAIGSLFVVNSISIRTIVFFLLAFGVGVQRIPYKLCVLAFLVGITIAFFSESNHPILDSAVWGLLAGVIAMGSSIYEQLFCGADIASLSRVIRNPSKEKFAVNCFYVFKIIPELQAKLRRIANAYKVYGRRVYTGKFKGFGLIILGFVTYFLEALNIMLANERVLERRRDVVLSVAATHRALSFRIFIVVASSPLVVLVGSLMDLP